MIRISMEASKTTKNSTAIWTRLTFATTVPVESKLTENRGTCLSMSFCTLFTGQNQPTGPENVDQILNECHPTTKKNKMFAGKWMELTQEERCHVFSLICGIQASMGRVWEEGSLRCGNSGLTMIKDS